MRNNESGKVNRQTGRIAPSASNGKGAACANALSEAVKKHAFAPQKACDCTPKACR